MQNNTAISLIFLLAALPAGWYAAALWTWLSNHKEAHHGK